MAVCKLHINYYYYYYFSCHRPILSGNSLEPPAIPPLRLQVSHCSTFRIMCYVPSTAVFCSVSTECLPGRASKFYITVTIIIIFFLHIMYRKTEDTILPVIMCAFTHSLFHILNLKLPACRRNFAKAVRTANKAERDCYRRHANLSFNHTDPQ
jgi:hypothetical protein